jgi:hypothetical protein
LYSHPNEANQVGVVQVKHEFRFAQEFFSIISSRSATQKLDSTKADIRAQIALAFAHMLLGQIYLTKLTHTNDLDSNQISSMDLPGEKRARDALSLFIDDLEGVTLALFLLLHSNLEGNVDGLANISSSRTLVDGTSGGVDNLVIRDNYKKNFVGQLGLEAFLLQILEECFVSDDVRDEATCSVKGKL